MPLINRLKFALPPVIALVAGLAIVALVASSVVALFVERDRSVEAVTKDSAIRWSKIGADAVARIAPSDPSGALEAASMRSEIERALPDSSNTTYRLFSSDGEVLISSEAGEVGQSIDRATLSRLESGGVLVGSTDVLNLDAREPGISEAVTPVTANGIAIAYFAATVDRREQLKAVDAFARRALLAVSLIVGVSGAIGVFVLYRYLTGRDRAQLELGRAARDLALAEQIAHVGHWSVDYRTGTTNWSPELYRIFGVDPDSFVPSNETVLPMILAEDKPRISQNIAALRSGKETVSYETRIRRPDGEIRVLDQTVFAQHDKTGRLTFGFGVAHDITDLRQATETLAVRERMFDRAIEAARAATWEWNLDGTGVVSRHFAEMMGRKPDAFKPQFDLAGRVIHPDDLERVKAALHASVNQGAPYDVEYRIQHAEGHYIWVSSRGQLQRDADGKPIRLSGTMIDISARRIAEQSLKESQEVLQLALDAANAGFFSRNEGEQKIYWSPRLIQMLGFPPGFAPEATYFNSLVHPDDRAGFGEKINQARETGEPFAGIVRVRHRAGHYLWLNVRGMTQTDARGKPVRHVGFILDVTAEKVAAEEIAKAKETLERAIEGSNTAIWEWDPTIDTFALSGRIASIIGYVPKESKLSSNELSAITHPDDLLLVRTAITEALTSGKQYDIEHRLLHADGHYVWVHSRARSIRDASGKVIRMAGSVTDITARRQAQDELRASRETLQLAITASNAGFFTRELNPERLVWSDRLKEIMHLPADFVPVPGYFNDRIYVDDKVPFLERIAAAKAQRTPVDVQVRVRNADEKYIWLHIRWVEQFDDLGKAVREIGFVRDITTEKTAAAALAASEVKFRDLIEGSIQGVVIHHKFKPLFCNEAYARMLGYEHVDEVLALPSLTVHLDDEARIGADDFWHAAMTGEIDGQTLRRPVIDRMKRKRWFDIIGRRITWDGQRAWQMSVMDVTHMVATQRSLKETEERFRVVVEYSKDVVALRTLEGISTYVSPASERITGFTPDEAKNTAVNDYVHPDDLPTIIAQTKELIANPRADHPPLQFRLRKKSGEYIWLESEIALVPSPDGKGDQRVLSVSRDITERVERENELKAINERLQLQTAKLVKLTQQLELERENANRANAAKSQFLAMMSHELRTPMTGILGVADLMASSSLRDEQRGMLGTLTRSAHTLLDLLNDLLDFAKIEAGHTDIDRVDFSIHQIVEDLRALFVPLASTRGNFLKFGVDKSVDLVYSGDAKRYRQIVVNLIGNANKFTEKGTISVNIAAKPIAPGQFEIETLVRDTGIGISPKNRDRLFQPFTQEDISTSRRFGGTGLGLAISKGLAEAMGGRIWVESEPGKGSTFGFTVLLGAGDPKKLAVTTDAHRRAPTSISDLPKSARPLAILIAEDNETTRILMTSMLEKMGHTITAVENGAEAMAVIGDAAGSFDLVLMDMQMPVMDGPTAMRKIRAQEKEAKRTPIIALTADAMRDHHVSYFAAGADMVVTKPVDWLFLVTKMSEAAGVPLIDAAEQADKAADEAVQLSTALLLDTAFLETIVGSVQPKTLATLLERFEKNARDYVQQIRAATTTGDFNLAKRHAHTLKGLAAQFGANRLSECARQVEIVQKSGGDLSGPVGELEVLLPQTFAQVDAWRANRPPPV